MAFLSFLCFYGNEIIDFNFLLNYYNLSIPQHRAFKYTCSQLCKTLTTKIGESIWIEHVWTISLHLVQQNTRIACLFNIYRHIISEKCNQNCALETQKSQKCLIFWNKSVYPKEKVLRAAPQGQTRKKERKLASHWIIFVLKSVARYNVIFMEHDMEKAVNKLYSL
jgi:hypothetical protein